MYFTPVLRGPSITVVDDFEIHIQKNEVDSYSHTISKLIHMNQRHICKAKTKNLEVAKSHDLWTLQRTSDMTLKNEPQK